jgi:hypothetical protein
MSTFDERVTEIRQAKDKRVAQRIVAYITEAGEFEITEILARFPSASLAAYVAALRALSA